MKKYVITIFLGIIILSVVLFILLGLRPRDLFVPSYRFLDGRSPITSREPKGDKLLYKLQLYIYSFEADFNDLCLKAKDELQPEGFVSGIDIFGGGFSGCYYRLRNRFPLGRVWICIYNNCQYIMLPDSNVGTFYGKDGWVMIEIVYYRGWRWPF